MTLFHLVLFAIVQGITEFLPISSSGHLILLHQWTQATPDALALDVAVHLGSILAVILYFRTESPGRLPRSAPDFSAGG
jgi:undecaprenyl-diphosphatase